MTTWLSRGVRGRGERDDPDIDRKILIDSAAAVSVDCG
jgi:hypothetical protein